MEIKDVLGLGKPIEIVTQATVDFAKTLFGPVLSAVGLDLAATYRNRRAVQVIEQARQQVLAANGVPTRVPLNILIPLLEAASIEEDDDMHGRWAALMASAANSPSSVPPAFPEVLRQLSPRDAAIIEVLVHRMSQSPERKAERQINEDRIYGIWSECGFAQSGNVPVFESDKGSQLDTQRQADVRECEVSIDNLVRLRLLEKKAALPPRYPGEVLFSDPPLIHSYWITPFAIEMIRACSPPPAE